MKKENTKEILRGFMRVEECNYADEKLCNKPEAFCKNVEDKYYELKTRTAEVEEGLKSALRVIGRAMAQNPDLANNRIGNVTVDTLVTELKNLLYKDLV